MRGNNILHCGAKRPVAGGLLHCCAMRGWSATEAGIAAGPGTKRLVSQPSKRHQAVPGDLDLTNFNPHLVKVKAAWSF